MQVVYNFRRSLRQPLDLSYIFSNVVILLHIYVNVLNRYVPIPLALYETESLSNYVC